jgi:hypothetical protein
MREIKFRAWDEVKKIMHHNFQFFTSGESENGWICFSSDKEKPDTKTTTGIVFNNPYFRQQLKIMQFTGLHDKTKDLTEVYEGDILDENGVVKGNVYESPQIFREGIDFVIAGMGTSAWRGAESIAMGRGCKYSE